MENVIKQDKNKMLIVLIIYIDNYTKSLSVQRGMRKFKYRWFDYFSA